jgi:hypothetical protein
VSVIVRGDELAAAAGACANEADEQRSATLQSTAVFIFVSLRRRAARRPPAACG